MENLIKKTVNELKDTFVGISSVRWANDRAKLSPSTVWDFELPTLRDSVDFNFPEPDVENSKIYGQSTAWASHAEDGDIALALTIPSTHESLCEWGFAKRKSDEDIEGFAETAESNPHGGAGTWEFRGYDIKSKVVEGMMMVVSEDGKKALVVKNFHGYATLLMDDLSGATPVGIRLSGTITTPVEGDTDGDVLFGTLKQN